MNETWNMLAAIGACATALITLGLLYIGYLEWRMRTIHFRGRLQFELVNNGEFISVVLSNTGECTAREIHISSNPPLSINFNNTFHYDGCVGTYESWLLGSTIHELLPHHSLTDANPFPMKDFHIHFANYLTIVINLRYTIEGKKIYDSQTIDIGLLRTQQTTNKTRSLIYNGLKEVNNR